MAAALRDNDGGNEMRIDIPVDYRRPGRREAVDRRRRSSRKIIEMTLALGGQAIGAVVAVALTNPTSTWAVQSVELCILSGLSFIFAALALRQEQPRLAEAVAKIGAVATAVAIVIAMTSNLPPFAALAAGMAAFVIISAAVALAS